MIEYLVKFTKSTYFFIFQVVFVAIFVVEVSSDAFFLRNNPQQEAVKRDTSYSVPQYSPPTIDIEDGYGAPAAPVLSASSDSSYSSPVVVTTKVKKSIPLKTSYQPIEIDDGYGSPAAPVLSG